jgi:hypothetical protein
MRRCPGAALIGLLACEACGFDPSGAGSARDGGPVVDGAPPDGAAVDAAPPPPPSHLLLTEAKTNPILLEFVEIYNPLCETVDLSGYHLADVPIYPLVPSWGDTPPVLAHQDAVLQFPAGATIGPNQVAVIARDGVAFEAAYGDVATYAIRNVGTSMAMRFIAAGDTLDMAVRNEGEPITLFIWDGASDLVTDVDMVFAGDVPAAGDDVEAKQAVAPGGVDGPDRDVIATGYLAEAATLPAALLRDTGASMISGAYQRVAAEGAHEGAEGGNGVDGHDETSEDTLATWEQDRNTVPTPGVVPDALRQACVTP